MEQQKPAIDIWIESIENYNLLQLCSKPSPHEWSVGQVYMHLIADTNFYIKQIKTCLSVIDNTDQQASPFAQTLFRENRFPCEQIAGDPSHSGMPQPNSKEQLTVELLKIKRALTELNTLVGESLLKGKTQHPGLGYFSGEEWLLFAEIHFQHHLRQKDRIDEFLTAKGFL